MANHRDILSSAQLSNDTASYADVESLSISSLMRSTLLPFKPGATEGEKQGGHFIIKIDIEGAEFQVLKAEANGNVLCNYATLGNKVVVIMEFHEFAIPDKESRKKAMDGVKAAKKKLEDCGVVFVTLDPAWA